MPWENQATTYECHVETLRPYIDFSFSQFCSRTVGMRMTFAEKKRKEILEIEFVFIIKNKKNVPSNPRVTPQSSKDVLALHSKVPKEVHRSMNRPKNKALIKKQS